MRNRYVVSMTAYDKETDKTCSFVLDEAGKYYVTLGPNGKEMFLNVNTEGFYGEKPINIVTVRQNGKDYLFSVPNDISLCKGEHVICDTRFGKNEGVTSSKSVKVNKETLEWLAKYMGATLPLKPVIGVVRTELFGVLKF